MKKFVKKVLLFFACAFFIFLITGNTANAQSVGKSLSYDPISNCFRFQSTDTKATSAIRYQTIGFYITRCQIGQRAETNGGLEYIKIDLGYDFGITTHDNGTQVVNVWTISRDDILALISAKGYTDWYNEVVLATSGQMEQTYYLKFDAIMVTKKPDASGNYILSGQISPADHWTEQGKPSYSLVESDSSKIRTYNKFSINELKRAYGWADPASIDNHFNLYYEITGKPTDITTDSSTGIARTEEWVTRISKATPDFVTYNTSSDGKFDIGVAIPTTEHISNGTEADQWYGYVDIGQHWVIRQFRFPYRFTKDIQITNARGEPIGTTIKATINESVVLNDSISYYYIQDIAIYDLQSALVTNGTYPSDLNYTSTSNVAVSCTINGQNNPSTFSKVSDENVHVTKPMPDLSLIQGSSQGECIATAEVRMQMARMTATNDYLSINGNVVLDNSHVYYSSMYHKHTEACYDYVYCGSTNFTREINPNTDPYRCPCGGNIKVSSALKSFYFNNGNSNGTCGICGATYTTHTYSCSMCWQDPKTAVTSGCSHVSSQPAGSGHQHESTIYRCDSCNTTYGALEIFYDYTCATCGHKTEYVRESNRPTQCNQVKPDQSRLICLIPEEGWVSSSQAIVYNELDLTNPAILPTETFSTSNMEIPARLANGEYHTKLQATYMNVLTGEMVTHSRSQYSGGNHIKLIYDAHGNPVNDITRNGVQEQVYANNEPIVVHTPIICPFHIVDAETETQLIHENQDVDYQLLLDGRYTFTFDSIVHSDNKGYENDAGDAGQYDKYVSDKAIRFPFEILYNGTYYNLTETGYTEWIILTEDDWEGGQFYIPAWATEITEANIQIMVLAINAHGDNGEDRTDRIENEANTDLNNYVAIFEKSVQLSGRMYGFQVVGISDRDMFAPITDNSPNAYSFVTNREERKLGQYNRLGELGVRYTIDRTLCDLWDIRNTLPFCDGKSMTNPTLGTLWKGTSFSFSVKTIANLWSVGEITNEYGTVTDQLQITPSYRYVYKDEYGNTVIREDVDIYYHNQFGDTEMLYTKMGSEADLSTRCLVNLQDGSFDNSYMWGEVEYTVDKLNEWTGTTYTPDSWIAQDRPSYNMSSIILNSDLRLLTGWEEEMANNLQKESDEILRYAEDFAFEDRFDYSMQTWYGSYYIPSTLLVAPKEIDVNKDGVVDENDDINGDGVVDLTDYALEYGLTDTSDIWLPTENAYLVLNFDIISVNENEEHLSYYGSSLDMWARETYNGSKEDLVDPSLPNTPANRKPYDDVTVSDGLGNEVEVPIVSGDVAIISLDDTTQDRYEAGIFFIN